MEYRYMKVDDTKEDKRLASAEKEKENIIVAGGELIDSVEIFNWSKRTWSPLQSIPEERGSAASFVHNDHLTLAGGFCHGYVDDMITMNIDPIPDISTHWSKCQTKLPAKLAYHRGVVYNDHLIVTGGEKSTYDGVYDCIHAVQLVPPYSVRLLSRMPEPRQNHGSEIFDDNLLIVGGETIGAYRQHYSSVLLYDIKKKLCKQLKPLPYSVSCAATVKWGDNVAIIGGVDKHLRLLDTVIIYNVKTEQSYLLPPMQFKRLDCSAVLLKNNIVVLGGRGEGNTDLKSVEIFNLASYTWDELPEMLKGRSKHTADAV